MNPNGTTPNLLNVCCPPVVASGARVQPMAKRAITRQARRFNGTTRGELASRPAFISTRTALGHREPSEASFLAHDIPSRLHGHPSAFAAECGRLLGGGNRRRTCPS